MSVRTGKYETLSLAERLHLSSLLTGFNKMEGHLTISVYTDEGGMFPDPILQGDQTQHISH